MIEIRPMRADDLELVADLSAQLGYELEASALIARFEAMRILAHHGMFVAESDTDIVGWIHVYEVRLLESAGYTEIGGVVVDQARRRRGIGRELVRAAETWSIERGFLRQRLYSGLHRKDAYQFYNRIGYEQSRPGMFQIDLGEWAADLGI